MAGIRVKRVYETPSETDGYRVLVDRVWPRGVKKADARIDEWCKDFAPSTSLRKWFGHDPEKWEAFKERYQAELRDHAEVVEHLLAKAREGPLTLVYSAKDPVHNNAVALKAYIEELL